MTPKQTINSINKKMERIEKNNTNIDFKLATRHFFEIEKYQKLEREKFFLEFEINHCKTCGKTL
jgi:hypothetical protein